MNLSLLYQIVPFNPYSDRYMRPIDDILLNYRIPPEEYGSDGYFRFPYVARMFAGEGEDFAINLSLDNSELYMFEYRNLIRRVYDSIPRNL